MSGSARLSDGWSCSGSALGRMPSSALTEASPPVTIPAVGASRSPERSWGGVCMPRRSTRCAIGTCASPTARRPTRGVDPKWWLSDSRLCRRGCGRRDGARGADDGGGPGASSSTTRRWRAATRRCCYHGRVASKVVKCERGRRVVLYKKQPGADRKVGHDRTGKDRWWSFAPRDQSRGHFYAKATRERHKGFVCLAARAPTVFFAGPPTDTTALPVGSE